MEEKVRPAEKPEKEEGISKWITFMGIFLMLTPLLRINIFLHFEYYQDRLPHLSDNLIAVRYLITILFRLVIFIAGIGILLRKDFFRKVILVTSFVTLLTFPWKHPRESFRVVARMMYGDYRTMGLRNIPEHRMKVIEEFYEKKARAFQRVVWIIDIVFALFLIYFFTLPKIREEFQ